jgi:DNA-binding transcriptional LysR family regulator
MGSDEFTLAGLRVVREVDAQGSISAAALALGYSQSAVSRQLAAIEAAAGEPLFVRGARGVAPTHAGRVLLGHADAALRRLDVAAAELRDARSALTDTVVCGSFPTALASLVPRALARLREAHPALEIRLREGGSVAQLRRLRARQVDVAVVAIGGGLDYDLSDLVVDRLAAGELRLAVGEGHRFAARGWVDVGELEGERWIVGRSDATGPQFGAWPTLEEEPVIAHAVRDWPARLGLVAAGLGVALVPGMLAPAVPPGVRVIEVDDPRAIRREAVAVTRPDPGPGAAALVQALQAQARETA